MEPPAQRIVARLSGEVDALMQELEAADVTADAWRDGMAALLARGHLAAFMAGQGGSDLAAADQQRVVRDLTKQISFLDRFAVEIEGAPEFEAGWRSRAQMYADAIGASFDAGKFKMWPLPALPRDGSTQCLSRCNCFWEIDELAGEGNADAYWRLGASDKKCQSCIERARQWAPLRIRNGELL